jgi:hypothetical protein
MEVGLKEILDIADVRACLLFDNQGQLLKEVGHDDLLERFEPMGEPAVQSLATLTSEGSECTHIDYVFDRFRVVIKDLGKAVLIVICQPRVDISLLRLTMGVVTNRWDEDPQVRKFLDVHDKKKIGG